MVDPSLQLREFVDGENAVGSFVYHPPNTPGNDTITWTLNGSTGTGAPPPLTITVIQLPSVNSVVLGVDRGDGQIGTVLVPDPITVVDTLVYGPNSSVQGTLHLPDPEEVLEGIQYGLGGTMSQGQFAVPPNTVVLDTYIYGVMGNPITGTISLPTPSQVQAGVTYGDNNGQTGLITLPQASDVRQGTNYGASNSQTGTLNVSQSQFQPGINGSGILSMP